MNDPGRLMLDVEGLTLSEEEQSLLRRPSVIGVVLFTRNYQDKAQLTALTAAIRACDESLLIAVDQEGGRVQRFRDGFHRLPALRRIGEAFEADAAGGLRLAFDAAWIMASELLACDIDISFAPVLDLYSADSRVINDRAFSADPEAVISLSRAYIDGLRAAGMQAVGKHFPGHGSVAADSHDELPIDTRSAELIRELDLRCFAECKNDLAGIMTAHVRYPEVDEANAGFSQKWISEILRLELGFDGVVFSDDLSMKGADNGGSVIDRAQLALAAGTDVLLSCNDRPGALAIADWLEEGSWEEAGSLATTGSVRERLAQLRGKPAPASESQPSESRIAAVTSL